MSALKTTPADDGYGWYYAPSKKDDRFAAWTAELAAQDAADGYTHYEQMHESRKEQARWLCEVGAARISDIERRILTTRDPAAYAALAADQVLIELFIQFAKEVI